MTYSIKVLRKNAEKQALLQRLSSLQEAVRVFLKKLGHGTVGVAFEKEQTIQLSPRTIKRYNKIADNIEKGKNVHVAKNVDDLIRQLNS